MWSVKACSKNPVLPGAALFLFAFLVACAPSINTSTQNSSTVSLPHISKPSSTRTPTRTPRNTWTPFFSPTSASALTPSLFLPSFTPAFTSTSLPLFRYKRGCLTLEKKAPPGSLSDGELLLGAMVQDGVKQYFLDTHDNTISEAPDQPITGIRVVSPDGKWLAYEDNRVLKIRTSNGQPRAVVQENGNGENLFGWVDNDQVVLTTFDQQVIIANVRTGSSSEFDFSNSGARISILSVPQFDNTRQLVVYVRGYSGVILENWQTGNVLWVLPLPSQMGILPDNIVPQWSVDGTRFALGAPANGPGDPTFELLILDRGGNLIQRTQMKANGFKDSTIMNPQWSPNSRYVTFWFDDELAVYDTWTNTVTNYCYSTDNFLSRPIWSPDSKQVAFGISPSYNGVPSHVVVIDIVKARAFQVADHYYVEGWLSTSP